MRINKRINVKVTHLSIDSFIHSSIQYLRNTNNKQIPIYFVSLALISKDIMSQATPTKKLSIEF